MRKPVLEVSIQVQHKQGYTTTEDGVSTVSSVEPQTFDHKVAGLNLIRGMVLCP